VLYQTIGDLVGLNESTIRKVVAGKRYADAPFPEYTPGEQPSQ